VLPIALPAMPDERVASHVVIVVDDVPADRDLLCLLLRTWGPRPVATADGWEALVCARTLLPALVITDPRMRRLDGRGLLALLRAGPEAAHIPVLVVTGEAGHTPGGRLRERPPRGRGAR
jgi:CheY-like chemotaxis protein